LLIDCVHRVHICLSPELQAFASDIAVSLRQRFHQPRAPRRRVAWWRVDDNRYSGGEGDGRVGDQRSRVNDRNRHRHWRAVAVPAPTLGNAHPSAMVRKRFNSRPNLANGLETGLATGEHRSECSWTIALCGSAERAR